MKILIVSQYFWPENFKINDLAAGLASEGNDVTVLTGMPNYPQGEFFPGYSFWSPRKETWKGVRILRVPLISRGKSTGIRLALNYFSFAFFGSVLGPVVYRGRPGAILVYQTSPITAALPAIIIKWLRKTPLYLWIQDLWPESLSATGAIRAPRILFLVGCLVRFIYKQCDWLLSQSRSFNSSIVEYGGRPDRIVYFPNSAEENYRSSVQITAEECSGLPPGFKIMFAGNIGVAQDFETILDAAELTKPEARIQWIILGEGRRLSWVKQQIISRNLEHTVFLLGSFPVERMPEFFSAADIMLVSLKREPIFALTMPAKTQSYLAAGKPILASLDGEGAEIIKEAKAGIAVPAGSPNKLAEMAIRLSRMNKEQLLELGRNGRLYFETHFERSLLLNQLLALLHRNQS